MPTINTVNTYLGPVKPEWIDYNGHMSEAFYVLIFGFATDELYEQLGMGAKYRAQHNCSAYTVEAHINYLQEVSEGEMVKVNTQLLAAGNKQLRFCHTMSLAESGEAVAFTELFVLFMDMTTGRTSPFPTEINTSISTMLSSHQQLALPQYVQRLVGQKN